MKLFELNSWRVQISFQLKTRKLSKKWLEFISQHKKNNAFTVFNQFIVSLIAPCVNTLHLNCIKVCVGGGRQPPQTPSCSAKLNLLCKRVPSRGTRFRGCLVESIPESLKISNFTWKIFFGKIIFGDLQRKRKRLRNMSREVLVNRSNIPSLHGTIKVPMTWNFTPKVYGCIVKIT
jgi:hypothetical protein